jgi:YHS domain-containing protein
LEAFLYFLLWAAVTVLALRLGLGRGGRQERHVQAGGSVSAPDRSAETRLRWIPPETAVDPVCGRTVRPARARPSVQDGEVYYFCSRECREEFEANPDRHLRRGGSINAPDRERTNGERHGTSES